MKNQLIDNKCNFYPNILLIDSDETSHLLLSEVFCDCKINLICANCGCSGLEQVKILEQLHLIITEIRLADVDGFNLFSRIKELNPNIPIIAITASVVGNIRERCLSFGFIDFIPKPISIDDFKNKILECIR